MSEYVYNVVHVYVVWCIFYTHTVVVLRVYGYVLSVLRNLHLSDKMCKRVLANNQTNRKL